MSRLELHHPATVTTERTLIDSIPRSCFCTTANRKNWLFIGSVPAGERAADFLTLVSSAVRNDLDVWAYLKDVLDHLLAGDTHYAALRPDAWRQAHPEAIREYRVTERRDLTERARRRLDGELRQLAAKAGLSACDAQAGRTASPRTGWPTSRTAFA